MRELAKAGVKAVNGGLGEGAYDDPDFPQPDIGDGRHQVFSRFATQPSDLPEPVQAMASTWHDGQAMTNRDSNWLAPEVAALRDMKNFLIGVR